MRLRQVGKKRNASEYFGYLGFRAPSHVRSSTSWTEGERSCPHSARDPG
jgi:hypothetical protein